MLYVLHNSSKYEEGILATILHATKYPFKEIINMKNNEDLKRLPRRENFSDHDFLLFYDDTKGTPALIKALDEHYSKENIEDIFEYISEHAKSLAVLPKVATFMPDDELRKSTWEKITSLCKVTVQGVDKSLIPPKLAGIWNELKKAIDLNNTFTIKVGSENIEIRPDSLAPSLENSITFSELLILYVIKEVFNFDRILIISNN